MKHLRVKCLACLSTQHQNNDAPAVGGDKYDISLQILQQVGIEFARQATTIVKRHVLRPRQQVSNWFDVCTFKTYFN